MATDVTVLSRRRPTTLARRFRAYTLAAGARRDRVLFTLALVVAFGFILAIFTWPGRFPTITVAPLILLVVGLGVLPGPVLDAIAPSVQRILDTVNASPGLTSLSLPW